MTPAEKQELADRLPAWLREVLFLGGVAFLAVCAENYYRDVWNLPLFQRWSIVLVAQLCIAVGRNRRSAGDLGR
jgi:hypothetical protein